MMNSLTALQKHLKEKFAEAVTISVNREEVTMELTPQSLLSVCEKLRDENVFRFDMLMDVCGVDYLHYGIADWRTDTATSTGFDRAVAMTEAEQEHTTDKKTKRFAVVYHLLSTHYNHRLRLRVFVEESSLIVPSVIELWPSANWFERETFDLFGILFTGHPDLRRILTDYGFIGHPFRKDFPLSGHVEVRYDATLGRVVYEPVDITPRVLVPKVIRDDHRYELDPTKAAGEQAAEQKS